MADWTPLDLAEDEEIIMVAAEDEEPRSKGQSSEAESEGPLGASECGCVGCSEGNPCTPISVRQCRCEACTDEPGTSTCWNCDDLGCAGDCDS